MKKSLLAIALVVCSASVAHAAPITFEAVLSGLNENPPTPSLGTGYALVTIDPVAHTLFVSATFSGLTGTTMAAHIHCCTTPPGNIGVATQTPSFVGFPLGVTSGSFSNTYDLTLLSSWNASFIAANGGTPLSAEAALFNGMMIGRAYFNIHTNAFPGGEIRGFLVQTPEPATFGLLGLGLAAIWTVRRRRRQ